MPEILNTPKTQKAAPRNKGGRPPKKTDEKRDIRVIVYYDAPTLEAVTQAADQAGVGVSFYIYEISRNGYVKQPVPSKLAEEIRQLIAVGNNLNQLTHLAHIKGIETVETRLKVVLQSIEEILVAISEKI